MFCTLLYVHSSFAVILMGKRELVALLSLSSWCLVIVVCLFLAVPWVCLQFVIVVFPDHTHYFFCLLNISWLQFLTRSRLTVQRLQTQIKLLLQKQSEQGLPCLLFCKTEMRRLPINYVPLTVDYCWFRFLLTLLFAILTYSCPDNGYFI